MRNIFENLSQNASAEQQHMLIQKKPSKWDRPDGPKPVAEITHTEETQSVSSDDRNHYSNGTDREPYVIPGSSTVFVVEEELPPPAFTKNIVAKFRQMEEEANAGGSGGETAAKVVASGGEKTGNLASMDVSSRSSRSGHPDRRGVPRSPVQQSPQRGREVVCVGFWFSGASNTNSVIILPLSG